MNSLRMLLRSAEPEILSPSEYPGEAPTALMLMLDDELFVSPEIKLYVPVELTIVLSSPSNMPKETGLPPTLSFQTTAPLML